MVTVKKFWVMLVAFMAVGISLFSAGSALANQNGQCDGPNSRYASTPMIWVSNLATEGVTSQAMKVEESNGYVPADISIPTWAKTRTVVVKLAKPAYVADYMCRDGKLSLWKYEWLPAGRQVVFVLPMGLSSSGVRTQPTPGYAPKTVTNRVAAQATCSNPTPGKATVVLYLPVPKVHKKTPPKKVKKPVRRRSACAGIHVSGAHASGGQCFVLVCGKSTVVTRGNQNRIGSSVCSPATGGSGGSSSGSGSGSGSSSGSSGGSGGATGGSGSGGTGGTGGGSSNCSSSGGGGGAGGGSGSGTGGNGGAGGNGGNVTCVCVSNGSGSVTCTMQPCATGQYVESNGSCGTPPSCSIETIQEIQSGGYTRQIDYTCTGSAAGDSLDVSCGADFGHMASTNATLVSSGGSSSTWSCDYTSPSASPTGDSAHGVPSGDDWFYVGVDDMTSGLNSPAPTTASTSSTQSELVAIQDSSTGSFY